MIHVTWWGLWLMLSGAAAIGYALAELLGVGSRPARLDESHAAARYAMQEREAPPVVAERPSAEEIEAAWSIVTNKGDCMGKPLAGSCFDCCPFRDADCEMSEEQNLERARAWLASHGIPVEEPVVAPPKPRFSPPKIMPCAERVEEPVVDMDLVERAR